MLEVKYLRHPGYLMSTYRYTTGLDYTFAQMTEMFNHSFEGYFVPMVMTPESTATFYRTSQIAPECCNVMHTEDGSFVGLTRVALRGSRAWCGGFGIAPAFRGKGMGKLLVTRMIEAAKKAGATTLQLEVLVQNTAAIKLYSGAGFTIVRQLVGVQISSGALPAPARVFDTTPVPVELLLPSLAKQGRPDWDREAASILVANDRAIATTGSTSSQSTPAGLIFQQSGERVQILAAILSPETTPEEVAALLAAAAGDAQLIQVYNEPEESIFFSLCHRLGFQEFFRQYEMLLDCK